MPFSAALFQALAAIITFALAGVTTSKTQNNKTHFMKSNRIFFLSIFLVTFCLGCKKDNKPVTEVIIGPQTLAETKSTFNGSWKLHYTYGGYSGTIKVNYPNTILQFTTSDSMYRWDSNIQTINSKVSYPYYDIYLDEYSTFMIEIEDSRNLMFPVQFAYKKKGDNLILGQAVPHPDLMYLTKQ